MESLTVTLTSANTNYNLLTLVRALDSTFVDIGDIVIQAADDGGSQVYRIGGSTLTDAIYGALMRPGDFSMHYPHLRGIYARSDTAGKTLNIQVVGR